MSLLLLIATMGDSGIVTTSPQPILILFGFESNSGGQAHDSEATTEEKSVTNKVRILNPLTFVFADLQVSVNQNLDHFGLVPHTTHGWHIGLRIAAEAGLFGNRMVYISEFGQGGSRSDQWTVGGTYNNKMIARYNAAWNKIIEETGQAPIVFMFNSWGINDAIAGTPVATFKAAYYAMLDQINAIHPVAAYMMDIIPSQYPTYRTMINQMATERSNIYLQDMVGKQFDDENHLGYAGMKVQSAEKINKLLTLL